MKKIVHFLSYLYPIRLYHAASDYSGPVEVRLEYGKKVLNTLNSNYSFGSLARVFQLALRQMPPPPPLLTQSEVLMLGFGAGTLVQLLRGCYHFKGKITGVDHDRALLNFARRHFPDSFEGSELVIEDARTFLTHNRNSFDLIFIDLFIDNEVADFATSSSFLRAVKAHLRPGGQLYHNLMIWNRGKFRALMDSYRKVFGPVKVLELLGSNQVIVASS